MKWLADVSRCNKHFARQYLFASPPHVRVFDYAASHSPSTTGVKHVARDPKTGKIDFSPVIAAAKVSEVDSA